MKTRIILGIFVMLSLCANVNAQQQRQRSRQPQNTQRQQVNKPQQQKPVHMHSEGTKDTPPCIEAQFHYDSEKEFTFIRYKRSKKCEGYIHALCSKIRKDGGEEYNLPTKLDYIAGPNEGNGQYTQWFRVGQGDFHEWKAIIQIPNKDSSVEEKIPDVIKRKGYIYCPNTKCDNNLSVQVASEKKKLKSGKTIYYYICENCGLKSKDESY